ncbi:MAG: Ig-like domain-containing protein [Gemmatimonadota bacterium]|nr:MAG: Ig-like domain-containing protein [Gemmatimonadota bacterium]
MRSLHYAPIASGLVLALAGCGGDGVGGPDPNFDVAAIEVFSGDAQSEPRGSELGQALVVKVTDDQDDPVSGATVVWTVSSGGGVLSASSSQTNSRGEASVNFMLSFLPGQSTVTARVNGVAQEASFTAIASDEGPITVTVDMSGIAFRAPLGGDDITIKLGDTVRWVNRDGVAHTATSNSTPAGGASFDSGLLGNSGSFSFTPAVAGTWIYFCEVHPAQMRDARITVVQ